MSMTYRTRRRLSRLGFVSLVLLLAAILTWLGWVIWLERYVVYTRDGAVLDFERAPQEITGVVASPPVAQNSISIYYNEGTDAIENTRVMTPLSGYYISYDALSQDMQGVLDNLKYPPAGSAIMVEMKGGYGSFYYTSSLPESVQSASVDVAQVDALVKQLRASGFYIIARVSSLCDYNFGLNHVTSGLYMLSHAGLWNDENGFYWLDPTNATTLNWITNVVNELKGMGFHEVMLSNFRFPASDRYIFNGDKDEALKEAANKLVTSCQGDNFVLSFGVTDPNFPLPDGRTRMYLEKVEAKDVAEYASRVQIDSPDVRLVFLAPTNDTRFNEYSALRPLQVAGAWEAQKADMEAMSAGEEEETQG